MVETTSHAVLSAVLKAVSDPTRREHHSRVCQEEPSRVTDLASHYDMSLNAISKHIKVQEKAESVRRKMVERTHGIEANIERVGLIEQVFDG
jgi:DNA-binding transcriptional ArsR family regulator